MNEITQLLICSKESNVLLKMAKSLPVPVWYAINSIIGLFYPFLYLTVPVPTVRMRIKKAVRNHDQET